MALIVRLCPAHGPYDDLTLQVADKEPRKCPACGVVGESQPCGTGRYMQGYDYERVLNPKTEDDKLEAQMVREHTRNCEKNRDNMELQFPKGMPRELMPRQDRGGTSRRYY